MSPRILVTCSRSWASWSILRSALERAWAEHPGAVLVHGDAPRGDRQAAGIWHNLGGKVEAWPAKWDEHGDDCKCPRSNPTCRFAGFRRNIAMVESGVDLVVAFIRRGSPGASHCAKFAGDAGIPVVRYTQGEM